MANKAATIQSISKFPKEMIAKSVISTMERVDLSDYCVNWLREFGRLADWSREDLQACVEEEVKRVKGLEVEERSEGTGRTLLELYYRARRGGSQFRISRNFRTVVIGLLRSRSLI